MAFALVRPIIDHRYHKSCIIPTINVRNYSKSSHKPDTKYRMKINDNDTNDTEGIIYDTSDDIELLKQLLKKRLPTPTLTKCHTNMNNLLPLAGASGASGGQGRKRINDTAAKEVTKKPHQPKKPRVKKSQTLQENESFDLSKIEMGRLKSKAATNHPRKPFDLNSNSSSKEKDGSFDFLSSPAINASKHPNALETSTPKCNTPKSHEVSESLDAEPSDVVSKTSIVSRATGDVEQLAGVPHPVMQQPAETNNSPRREGDSEEFESRATCEGDTNMDKSLRDSLLVQKLKKDISEKNKMITKQNKQIEDYIKILKDREDIIRDLTHCKIELQRAVLDQFFHLHDIVRDLKQSKPETASPDGSHLSTGYLNRVDFKVHVGRGQWVEQKIWQYLFSLTKPSEFVRELSRALIGEAVLMKSTVKGRGSNRRGRGNIKSWDRLDPVKVEAIRDALNHFLKSMKFREMPALEKANHVHSVTDYLQSFISDLKSGKMTAQNSNASENHEVVEEISAGGEDKESCGNKDEIPRKKNANDQIQPPNPKKTAESSQKRGEKQKTHILGDEERRVEESENQSHEDEGDKDEERSTIGVLSEVCDMGILTRGEALGGEAAVDKNLKTKQDGVQNGKEHDCTKLESLTPNRIVEIQKTKISNVERGCENYDESNKENILDQEGIEEQKPENKTVHHVEQAKKSYRFPIEVSSDDDSDEDGESVCDNSIDRNDTVLLHYHNEIDYDPGKSSEASGNGD